MKLLDAAYPQREDIPRNGSIHSLIDCEPYRKPQPTQLIYFLSYYTEVKIIVAARPEGAFHKMYWKSQLHLSPFLLRPAIKAVCHSTLDYLWLTQRHSFTRKILNDPASNSSFTEALDVLDIIRRQTSGYIIAELPPPLRRSQILYTSFIARFYESHTKLEMRSLARILNLILAYHSPSINTLRSNRPLSLLQLTLCFKECLVNNCLFKGAFEAPPDIRDMCKEVAKLIKEQLYPFMTLREMDNPPFCFDKGAEGMDSMALVQEAITEVCFLRPSLAEFLTSTTQGRELL
ncbi:hypothetical protein B0T09DRAFT_396442 [Sordaria sp. MPI-SDFR-AT-0083]|nr:hypothetical protein B0T09DRAFT_396442 [Sordaria sp. MPI-SDFR-AT-0083]